MFRRDRLTVKRAEYTVVGGEATYGNLTLIKENIPCHLSVNLNNTVKIQNAPYVLADFTLFLDYVPNLDIKENDILYVVTDRNQTYKLIAGEIKIYAFTIQIKCRQEKIIES